MFISIQCQMNKLRRNHVVGANFKLMKKPT